MFKRLIPLVVLLTVSFFNKSIADTEFQRLIDNGSYQKAVEYADEKIPAASRNSETWCKIGKANEKIGLTEKALACYRVAGSKDKGNFNADIGMASVYNTMKEPDKAMLMARIAMQKKPVCGAFLEYAKAARTLGKTKVSEESFKRALEADPASPEANLEMGCQYLEKENYLRAVTCLNTALQYNPDPDIALKIADAYLKMNDLKNASISYKQSIKISRKPLPSASIGLARVYFLEENHKKCVKEMEKTANRKHLSADDCYILAVSLEKTGQKKKAVTAYRNAIKKYGNRTTAGAIHSRLVVAEHLQEKNQYNSAVRHFNFIIKHDVQTALSKNVYHAAADAYEAMKKPEHAISVLNRCITADSKNVEACTRLAVLHHKTGNFDAERVMYNKLISLRKNDPKVYIALAKCYQGDGDTQKALELYAKSFNIRRTPQAAEGLAVCAYELNQQYNAKNAAEAAVALDPEILQPRIILSEIYFEKVKQYKKAAKHLEVLVRKNPDSKKYWRRLAESYQHTGEKSNLVRTDERIVKIFPKETKSNLRLATHALENGNKKSAYRYFRNVFKAQPNNLLAVRNLARLSREFGKKEDALCYLQKYLALNPNDAITLRDLGNTQYELKKYNFALDSYRSLEKMHAKVTGYYKQYVQILMKKKLYHEARAIIGKSVKVGEADAEMYMTLASIHIRYKKYADAVTACNNAFRKDPKNSQILKTMAQCQKKTGDISGAIVSYEQIAMIEKSVDAYRELGDLYLKTGKKDMAVRNYMKLLDISPNFPALALMAGSHCYQTKDFANADKYLAMVKDKTAEKNEFRFMYGESCCRNKNYLKGAAVLERIPAKVIERKKNWPMLKMLADAYCQIGKDEVGLKTYKRYVKVTGANDADAFHNIAYLNENTDREEAIGQYYKNVKRFPKDHRNWLRLGILYSQSRKTFAKAIRCLKKAESLEASSPEVFSKTAKIYQRMGRGKEEFFALKQYLRFKPQNISANRRAGSLLFKSGHKTESLRYLEVVRTAGTEDLELLGMLAQAYAASGRTAYAVKMLKNKPRKIRENPEIRYHLSSLYFQQGQKRRAEKEVKNALKSGNKEEYLILYAEILTGRERYKKAKKVIAQIRKAHPENIRSLCLLARIQKNEKDYRNAIITYKQVTFVDNDNMEAMCELGELYLLGADMKRANRFFKRALKTREGHIPAILGLAKVAKLNNNQILCRKYLKKAQRLEPENKVVVAELKNLNQ